MKTYALAASVLSAAVLAGGTAACVGTIGDGTSDDSIPRTVDPEFAVGGSQTRLGRLTHRQYDNTVADLLKVKPATPPSGDFQPDADFGGFDNNADALIVRGALAADYQRSAEKLAAQAVAGAKAQLVKCTPTGDGTECATQFIREFGRRAFRRPIDEGDVQRYLVLFKGAANQYPTGTPFDKGVQLVIETMLQSPNFLYRSELSQKKDDKGAILLDDFEIASRLSYMLWNSMPDDVLATAADKSEVHTDAQVKAQALRLLADPRARDTVTHFHEQWMQLSRYSTNYFTKDGAVYPNFPAATLTPILNDEARTFVNHVTFEANGNYRMLLTAGFTFANQDTARYYGAQASGAALQKIDLNTAQRAGFLTQIGFLASHAYSYGASPVHRGVFIQRQILCNKLPDPPAGVNFQLPPPSPTLRTTRERLTAHTDHAPCNSCHTTIINPAGFAFEHYDGIGQWREQDNGAPVDSAAELVIDGKKVAFKDGVELSKQLSESAQAQRCYVANWMRYAYGREESEADEKAIASLAQKVADPKYAIKDLIIDLTQMRSFTRRPADGGQ